MRQLTTDHLTRLLADHEPPCISLNQPTHRQHPDNQQDPVRYRNLLAELEKSLRQKAWLYEGDGYALDPVELTNVPSTITEVLGDELTSQHLSVGSYGAGASRTAGSGVTASIYPSARRQKGRDRQRSRPIFSGL